MIPLVTDVPFQDELIRQLQPMLGVKPVEELTRLMYVQRHPKCPMKHWDLKGKELERRRNDLSQQLPPLRW